MAVVIREATAGDYEGLCRLMDAVDALHRARLPHVFRQPDGPAREREYILSLIEGAASALFVAEAGGALVGFVVVLLRETPPIPVFVPRRYAVVDTLGVAEGAQRQGIGRALMARAEGWARERGATDIELNVYAFNREAVAFYRTLGYEMLRHTMSRRLE